MKGKVSSKKKGHRSGSGRQGEHPYGDRGQIILFFVFLVIWIPDSFVFKFSTILAPYVPVYLRAVIAVLILLLAVYLASSGHRAVSDEMLSSPRVLKDGAFARVRHPLYLAAILFYISLFTLTLSLISLFVFIGISIFYNVIAAYEEKFLEDKFGQEYRDYKKNVPRWIPCV